MDIDFNVLSGEPHTALVTLGIMIAENIPQIKDLSLDQKLILAAELWDEIAIASGTEAPTPGLLEAIKERMAFNSTQPLSTWEAGKTNNPPLSRWRMT